MRAYLKELIITAASILFLSLAVAAYFKAVSREKENSHPDAVYTLVPDNLGTLICVNRPHVLSEMIRHSSLRRILADEIPDIYLSIISATPQAPLIVFSFHPQGVVCYVQAPSKTTGPVVNDLLPERFKPYPPHEERSGGIDFYYYPDTEGRFFGYYIHNGVLAASYSRKLLEEAAARQQVGDISLPAAINRLRLSASSNEPVNIIFRAGELGVSDAGYLSADLYMSGGSIYCRGSIDSGAFKGAPTLSGDTLFRNITDRYPYLKLEFQIETEGEYIDYTAWTSR
ncbi:MAG: hypothetical protein LBI58_00375 [Tannerellaceae bacterium]|jgi:hypothetical protein|nr:hypothetical protein [Tannerellaceae bacterium]